MACWQSLSHPPITLTTAAERENDAIRFIHNTHDSFIVAIYNNERCLCAAAAAAAAAAATAAAACVLRLRAFLLF